MDVVNRRAPSTDVFVELDANDELGAPADPTSLPVQMAWSATRRIADSPTWLTAAWWTNPDAIPPVRYAFRAVTVGELTEGVWWPFALVQGTIVPGAPFRVE